jgi:transposase-like protein
MVLIAVKCPDCGSTEVGKYGKSKKGVQRYKCKNSECKTTIFQLEYQNNGCNPGIEVKIINMAVNASGIRDTARALKISKKKVSDTLKKQNLSYNV